MRCYAVCLQRVGCDRRLIPSDSSIQVVLLWFTLPASLADLSIGGYRGCCEAKCKLSNHLLTRPPLKQPAQPIREPGNPPELFSNIRPGCVKTALRQTGCPTGRRDSQIHCLILTGCTSISASGQYHSLFLLPLSLPSPIPPLLHHRTSPLSQVYLSLQTKAKPVVTDKASLTKCNMVEERKSASWE